LLKIWNLNKYTGIMGIFNCQGAGWCKVEKKNRIHDSSPMTLSGSVRAQDVDFLPRIAGDGWKGDTVLYAHRSGDLVRLPKGAAIPVTLKVLEFELYTVTPIKDVAADISFAPIGLINMFNSGGAIDVLDIHSESKNPELNCAMTVDVRMKVRGCGTFGAYSTHKPKKCSVDSCETEFTYDSTSGLVTFIIPVSKEEMYRWDVKIEI